MELSVTPAGSLRLWQASDGTGDAAKSGGEPGMQADQWGAAASAASGVRFNATLDSGRCMSNNLCTFLLPVCGQQTVKNPEKCPAKCSNRSASRAVRINAFSYAAARYALRFLALFPCFIHRGFSAMLLSCPHIFHAAHTFPVNGGPDRI